MIVKSPDHRGFSFVELMVAILILAMGLLPIFWFFSRSNMGTIKTRDEILAQQYAAELIDYARARGYAANEVTGEEGSEIREIEIAGQKTTVEERFVRRLYVKDLRPDHHSEWPCRYRTVTAEIRWQAETQQRSLRLTGLIYAPD